VDQLVLFGCAGRSGPVSPGSVSTIYCDPCLGPILEDCVLGIEQWRPHPNYDGYLVSSLGYVKSVPRVVVYRDGRRRSFTGRVLTPFMAGSDYPTVRIRGRHRRVHHMVLETYIGPCPTGLVACHWDDDNNNATLMNLRWDTKDANKEDRKRNGRIICSFAGCRFTARTAIPGSKCELHYRAFRHEVAQRAMALSVRIG
jgi:hypothetical protein